jgi:hypothetical protein
MNGNPSAHFGTHPRNFNKVETLHVSMKKDRIIRRIDSEDVNDDYLMSIDKFKVKFSNTVPQEEVTRLTSKWQHKII